MEIIFIGIVIALAISVWSVLLWTDRQYKHVAKDIVESNKTGKVFLRSKQVGGVKAVKVVNGKLRAYLSFKDDRHYTMIPTPMFVPTRFMDLRGATFRMCQLDADLRNQAYELAKQQGLEYEDEVINHG